MCIRRTLFGWLIIKPQRNQIYEDKKGDILIAHKLWNLTKKASTLKKAGTAAAWFL